MCIIVFGRISKGHNKLATHEVLISLINSSVCTASQQKQSMNGRSATECVLSKRLSAWKGHTKWIEHNKQFISADAAVNNGELKGGKTQQS